jgi:hypothetical protein
MWVNQSRRKRRAWVKGNGFLFWWRLFGLGLPPKHAALMLSPRSLQVERPLFPLISGRLWPRPGLHWQRHKLTFAGRAIALNVSFPASPRTHADGQFLPFATGN